MTDSRIHHRRSRGVGAAVARKFHEAGARVALPSRTEEDLGLGDMRMMTVSLRPMSEGSWG